MALYHIRRHLVEEFGKTCQTGRSTHLTPAEKLTTGKKSPSVLKFSNIPCTGCPLIRKEMLGAPKSRQQLTTSSEASKCWFTDATALGTRPISRQTQKETENCVTSYKVLMTFLSKKRIVAPFPSLANYSFKKNVR